SLLRRPRWLWGRRLGDQLASPGDRVGLGTAAGEQAVVPDAMEPLRQDVQHEAPDELARGHGHGLVARRSFDPVILDLERHALLVGAHQPAVGDGDAVGVAGEIATSASQPRWSCTDLSPW